jgi:hypothetical protein
VDPRIRLAIELTAECRTGQVLRCTRAMLTLTGVDPADYESVPAGALSQIEIPDAGRMRRELPLREPASGVGMASLATPSRPLSSCLEWRCTELRYG